MKTDVYTQDGKKKGTVDLPEKIFAAKWNEDLVHQVVVGMQANARKSIAHTKDRSEVRGGGKKPWQQKGLGRARHGSIRSPIWRGGGITFGPRNEKNYSKKINKKMRFGALASVLSKKHKDGEVLFIDEITFKAPKTSDAKKMLDALSKNKGLEMLATKKHNKAYIALADKDIFVAKSFSNFGNTKVGLTQNLNPVEALTYKYVVFVSPKESIAALERRGEFSAKKDKQVGKVTK